jgi:hypothetical protein
MSGTLPVYEKGPITLSVALSNVILGGNVVMSDPTNTGSNYVVAAKGPSSNKGAVTVIGVALNDAVGPSVSQGSTDPLGNAILALTQYPNQVTVALIGVFNLVYAGTCAFGGLVRTVDGATAGQTTAGQVYPYTAGSTTYDEIIGKCIQPGGVTAVGATGLTIVGIGSGI